MDTDNRIEELVYWAKELVWDLDWLAWLDLVHWLDLTLGLVALMAWLVQAWLALALLNRRLEIQFRHRVWIMIALRVALRVALCVALCVALR